ncbi:MAG: hypothetical protein QF760_02235 [Candidatus Thalassarchaeaceae archaeon]|jgi:pantoate kinase|nr:hypothetical protein [Candidatus Thalassarchaeaceae archaeon]MDP6703328.1 hypothetical protein [Candidatus Thalassarchaeaceae archaeon]MDP7004099.1 hypothetical protein [Candidatus Thalassarchaeaceae archaeon]
MTTRFGRGQCGAHLTLLFAIDDLALGLEQQGSVGAGLCIEDGTEAIAKGEDGGRSLVVSFLGESYNSTMYDEVLEVLCSVVPEAGELAWELSIKVGLPVSQGFGMSASGAIAAAMAFQRALGIPHEECLRRSFLVAHIVERSRSSGLGDTTALAAGGVERRLVAGSPFSGPGLDNGPGISEGWTLNTPILLSWKSETGVHTSQYIDDPRWKNRISEAGKEQMGKLGVGVWDQSRWSELIESSRCFAEASSLLADSSRSDLLSAVNRTITAANLSEVVCPLLCMLGESVVIVPKDAESDGNFFNLLSEELRVAGLSTFRSRVGPLA